MDTLVSIHNGKIFEGPALPEYAHLGVGIFETFIVHSATEDLNIIGFDLHLKRLEHGREFFDLISPEHQSIIDALKIGIQKCQVDRTNKLKARIVLLKKDWFITLEDFNPIPQWGKFAKCIIVQAERPYPEHKTCSAIVSFKARELALKAHADEALLIDRGGILREGAWSNFFWVNKHGDIFTPKSKILPGITRELAINLLAKEHEVIEKDFLVSDVLAEACECFLTLSTYGIVPIHEIEGVTYEEGSICRILKSLYSTKGAVK